MTGFKIFGFATHQVCPLGASDNCGLLSSVGVAVGSARGQPRPRDPVPAAQVLVHAEAENRACVRERLLSIE